jgi:hypothetical protein
MPDSSWTAPIDLYCERLDPGFWAEPLNAVSNASFILAGLAALAMLRRIGRPDRPALALVGVTFAVGTGSFLFHTFANRWASLADVIPIAAFIHGYLCLALARFAGWPAWGALLGTVAFAALAANVGALAAVLVGLEAVAASRGSIGYVPALLALALVGGALVAFGREARTGAAGRSLLVAAAVFALSLAFRTADLPACGAVPTGTHFLWHALNGVVLFILLRAAILHRRRLR